MLVLVSSICILAMHEDALLTNAAESATVMDMEVEMEILGFMMEKEEGVIDVYIWVSYRLRMAKYRYCITDPFTADDEQRGVVGLVSIGLAWVIGLCAVPRLFHGVGSWDGYELGGDPRADVKTIGGPRALLERTT